MLAKMNLARWIIVLALLFSVVAGWMSWRLHQERVFLDDMLTHDVPGLCQDVLVKSANHTRLYKEYQNTGSGPQDNLKTYIVKQATRNEVRIGNVTLTNRDDKFRGGIDKKIVITPQFKQNGQDRVRIANFLHYLEDESRRLRVTRVHLEPEQRRLKEHEISNDRWLWDAEVTVREKTDE